MSRRETIISKIAMKKKMSLKVLSSSVGKEIAYTK
jgi:hypothetical protein